MGQQTDWRFCEKCHSLFYDGLPTKGHCPGGILGLGGHTAQGFTFDLSFDMPENATAQTSWRYCSKCGVMFYDGFPDKGSCASGGGHQSQGLNFTLPHDVAETPHAQAAWRYCGACHCIYYDGYTPKGMCPATKTPTRVGDGAFYSGHQPSGFNFVLPHDLPPAPGDGYPTFSLTGPVWVVGLDHQEAQTVEDYLDLVSAAITKANIPPPVDEIAKAVTSTLSLAKNYIKVMDDVGGGQGVDVQGVIGVNGVIVTPHVSGLYQKMIEGARTGIAAATIADFLIALSASISSVGTGLGLGSVAAVFAALGTNIALGWAVAAAAVGAVINVLLPTPDPNDHGGIHADRTSVGAWESFFLSEIPPGNLVSILAWLGLFSAQNGGDDKGDVFANRPTLGPWETWAMLDNSDGTVSFQSVNGRYLSALSGGGPGSYCSANSTTIGPNEKFRVQYLPDGHVSLKTVVMGTYLSVQPGK